MMETRTKTEVFPWNQSLLDRLDELRDQDALPHAIALSSKEGWGGTQLLKITCNQLVGFEPDTDTSNHASGNLMWIAPEGAVIKIDQVRSAIEFAYKTSRMDHYKVIAISQGHLLNVNAANALLKVVEEPPTGTIHILETTKCANLPETIRSRFHRFSPDLSVNKAKVWLAESGIDLSDQQFAEIGHAPLQAKNYELISFSGFIDIISEKKVSEIIDQVLALDSVAWLGSWYRFILGRLAIISSQLEQKDFRKVFDFCDELTFSRKEIELSNSANERLLIERLVIIWRNLRIDGLTQHA